MLLYYRLDSRDRTLQQAVRRLHNPRKCPLIPFVDYHDADLWSDEKPPMDQYHDWCKRCFGKTDPALEDEEAESSASTGQAEEGHAGAR